MSSEERKETRYQRRKLKRKPKQSQPTFNQTFTFEHLWKSRQKAMCGVGWKASVQTYRNHSITNIAKAYKDLHSDKFKSRGFIEFNIIERGKPRHIKSIHISERVIQKCLCDYAIIPIIKPRLLYDNGACIRGKGIDFSLNRMKFHLRDYYNHYHTNEGYVLLVDFSKYFDTINHNKLKEILNNAINDKNIVRLISQLIDDFGDDCGLGLGSQISQICALLYPTKIDKYIINQFKVRYFGRYMDDSYIIHPSKTILQKLLKVLNKEIEQLGIKLNNRKTQIIKIKNGIVWLKLRFFLSNNGKIYIKPNKKNIVHMCKVLKKFATLLINKQIAINDIKESYHSWIGHMRKSNSSAAIGRINKIYNRLFQGEILKWQ